MENTPVNPFIVTIFFIARCLVPLVIMLGISYLLQKLGVIRQPPKRPSNPEDKTKLQGNGSNGGLAHG